MKINLLFLVFVSVITGSVHGVHYTQRKAFTGKFTPAIAAFKKSMTDKLHNLRVGYKDDETTTTTTVMPVEEETTSSSTTVRPVADPNMNPGDGEDIAGASFFSSLFYK